MSTKYETFARLHDDFLILPNAWDAGTARLMQHAGAQAIATSSAAVAWTHGYADGEAMPPELALQTVHAIAGAVDLPVSADIEAGYGDDPNVAGERAVQVLDAGAVGINIEDGADAPDLLVAKIEAVKKATSRKGAHIWINARTDVYLRKQASGDEALKETLRRAALYRDAGADSLFVPAVIDAETLRTITGTVKLPVNVLAWPGLPDAATLKTLGVRRLSAGSGIGLASVNRAHALAKTFLADGKSDYTSQNKITGGEINGMMRR